MVIQPPDKLKTIVRSSTLFAPLLGITSITAVSTIALTSPLSSALDTKSVGASVRVAEACSITASDSGTATPDNPYEIIGGTYAPSVKTVTMDIYCNDKNGYSLYAVGYGYNSEGVATEGITTMNSSTPGSTNTIPTGTDTSTDVSNWSFKLSPVSGTFAPSILSDSAGSFSNYHAIPDHQTKVATFTDTIDVTTASTLTSTYAVAVSPYQTPDVYTGQVKYTLVHPNYANSNGKNVVTIATSNATNFTIDGVTYTNGQTLELVPDGEPHIISADTFASGYEFSNWSATGGIIIVDADSSTTTFTIEGNGTLTLKGGVSLYNTIASASKGNFDMSTLNTALTTANSGVYKYTGSHSDAASTNDIYFYRGILDSSFASSSIGSSGDGTLSPNYVKLTTNGNTTCWRIIRTTGTGGVKMIYNGNWTGSTCANAAARINGTGYYFNRGVADTQGDDYFGTKGFIVYAGYNFNDTYAYNNTSFTSAISNSTLFGNNNTASNARTEVENWYNTTIGSSNNSLFETSAGYCNDRTTYDTDGNPTTETIPYAPSTQTNFGFRQRAYVNSTASLACTNSSDLLTTSNGLGAPVALVTGDEAVLAGNGFSDKEAHSASSYLTSGSNFWSLSSYYRNSNGYVDVANVHSGGDTNNNGVFNAYGLRPVVSLTPGTHITGGTGTAADPWTVR